jgi:hypothetical protein
MQSLIRIAATPMSAPLTSFHSSSACSSTLTVLRATDPRRASVEASYTQCRPRIVFRRPLDVRHHVPGVVVANVVGGRAQPICCRVCELFHPRPIGELVRSLVDGRCGTSSRSAAIDRPSSTSDIASFTSLAWTTIPLPNGAGSAIGPSAEVFLLAMSRSCSKHSKLMSTSHRAAQYRRVSIVGEFRESSDGRTFVD